MIVVTVVTIVKVVTGVTVVTVMTVVTVVTIVALVTVTKNFFHQKKKPFSQFFGFTNEKLPKKILKKNTKNFVLPKNSNCDKTQKFNFDETEKPKL